jgi:PAS domain S-box-containing protein
MINRQENENSFNNDDEAIQDTEIHPVVDPFQTSAEHYRILAENVSDTVWLMDMNLKVTYISPSVTRLRGFTLEELNRIPFDQQMTPESFLRAITLLQETLTPENLSQTDKKITASIELEFYKKDGSSFWSENKFVLLRDEQGKPVHILSSGRDITERKRAMEALRYSEYRYRTLIDQAANALFVHDLDGKIVEVNQRACESLGYTQDELLSMTVMDFEQDFDLASARIVWDKIEPGQPSSVSGHHRRKDGSFFPVEIHFACLDIHGQRLIMGLVTDISERKEAEETIRYHANLIEQITDAIVSTDLDECIMSWNHGAEKIYGWRAEEVRGKILNDVVKTDFLSFTRSQVLQTVLKKGSWSGEVIQCERDGRTITVQATLSAITAENLKPNGIVAVFRDITEYKRTEEALQFSEARYKSLFLNMLEGFAYCKMIYEDGRPVDFIYLNVNPAFEKLTNLSNVVGKPVSEVIPGIRSARGTGIFKAGNYYGPRNVLPSLAYR